MQPIAQTSSRQTPRLSTQSAMRGLNIRWSLARTDGSGEDRLVLTLVPGQATLERVSEAVRRVVRAEHDLPAAEIAVSSCGQFTSLCVPGVLDAVFKADNRCVYARCAWIAELNPPGGQCECVGGELSWNG